MGAFAAQSINSRKNRYVQYFRSLGRERSFRLSEGKMLCDGQKLADEAVQNGAVICEALVPEGSHPAFSEEVKTLFVTKEIYDYASPLKNSPGPLFSVRFPQFDEQRAPGNAIVLEKIQDPGNVGMVLRSAAAFGCDVVLLVGDCADPYGPKAVRASMGAVFRQRIVQVDLNGLRERLERWKLPLYGAALHTHALSVRDVSLRRAAVAVGNEGSGLSGELLDLCDGKIVLPMTPGSESLNAAVAASVLLWEMSNSKG